MIIKRNIRLTRNLIGILIPLFSTVCLATNVGYKPVSYTSINLGGNSPTLQKENIPENDRSIRQNVDFIYRLKNYRLYNWNYNFLGGEVLHGIPYPESFPTPYFSVPRPAYYNYLFMFKPFESKVLYL